MKKSASLIFALVLTTYSIYSQNVKVSDYVVPVSQAGTMRFDGNWNFAQNGDTVTSNIASGTLSATTFYSSLPLAWFVNLDASGTSSARNNSNYNISFNASFQKYVLEAEDWFGFSKYSAVGKNTYAAPATDVSVGFGYGRYINATALAKAVRIESHFLSEGVIYEYLPKAAILKIASIIEKENEYSSLYGSTFETIWIRDIEREIQASGIALDESLGAMATLRIRQVLFGINERVNKRYYGWATNIGFLFPLTTYNKKKSGYPNLSFNATYSIPLNWALQVNSTTEISTPMDSLFFQDVIGRSGIDFIYELNNRVNIVSSYRFALIKSSGMIPTVSNYINLSFWYYIENNINFTVNSNYSKEINKPKQITTTVGLQYNLY